MEGIMSARAASARIAAAKNPNEYNFLIILERVVSCSVFCRRVNSNFSLRFSLSARGTVLGGDFEIRV